MIRINGMQMHKGNQILYKNISLDEMCSEVEKHFGIPKSIDIDGESIVMNGKRYTLIYEQKEKILTKKVKW